MRIGFQAGTLNERGMSVALYDYARGVQDILGHEAFVFYNETKSAPAVVEKFGTGLTLVPVRHGQDARGVSEPYRLDFCYYIREGRSLGLNIAAERAGVHAVFRHFDPHGDVYAYVSDWLAGWMTGGLAPAVPHIVDLPEAGGTLRQELGLPADAFVVGRYGGFDQFNLPFAHAAVKEALDRRSNLHFLFVNTEKFLDHPRALFLPAIVDDRQKSRFIATCDAGINAKKIGESFGLAIAEFLMFGKPVFSWAGGMDQNHVAMTPKTEWIYKTRRDLVRLLTDYAPSPQDSDIACNSVTAFRPEPVMRTFEKVFLGNGSPAKDLRLSPGFKARRLVQEKALRARFLLWKGV
ncbi:glycosyltransferase family protein [Roseibium sp. M-1]